MTVLRDCFPSHLGEKADLTFGSLCTGYGGLDLGVATVLGGGRLLWVADPDPHVSKVLATRMPDVPNLGDITTIDWQQVESVDVLTAGFPCQDISAAGRRAGIRKGTRSGIWHQVVTAVRHLRPTLLVVENVAALRWRQGGLDIVLGDLAEVGYDAQWTSVRHRRTPPTRAGVSARLPSRDRLLRATGHERRQPRRQPGQAGTRASPSSCSRHRKHGTTPAADARRSHVWQADTR